MHLHGPLQSRWILHPGLAPELLIAGPVSQVSIDILLDSISEGKFKIAVKIAVDDQAKTADRSFKGDDRLLGSTAVRGNVDKDT